VTTVLVDGQPQEIEAKPLTVLCHQGGIGLEVPSHVEISAVETLKRFDQLSPEDWDFIRTQPEIRWLVNKVFQNTNPLNHPLHTWKIARDVQHVIGMMLLLLETMAAGKQPFLRCPETYLHPRSQLELTSILVGLSQGKSIKDMADQAIADEVAERMER
jgi:hypothetical protein